LVVHFGEVANGKPIYHGAQVDGESDAAEGTGKGYEMKTRYQLLRGYYEESEEQYLEALRSQAPRPCVEFCQECNEPIIDGQASCHKMGCKSNQEIEF
jgi:hypothetical protein